MLPRATPSIDGGLANIVVSEKDIFRRRGMTFNKYLFDIFGPNLSFSRFQ
jgi:hypothetical protein